MKNLLFILVIVAFSVVSCELERSNPLDPDNNSSIDVPTKISNVSITSSGSGSVTKWVKVEWQSTEDADAYMVYRALDYDGSYVSIVPQGIPNTSDTTCSYRDNDVYAGNYYWYRIAGRSEEGLIGPLSTPVGRGVE